VTSPNSFLTTLSSQRFIKEGAGWRIGWNGSATLYQGLLAGSDWAVELTASEFQDFCRLAHQLAQTLNVMATELMDEERIACEAESELIWLEVEGFPHHYSLRFILTQGRQCEGEWPGSVVGELLTAIAWLAVF
jgi:hypothetical protein